MMAMEGERLIMTQSQYKCLELLGRDGSHNKTGSFCSRFWDGLLCWDETPAGNFASQNCPDYPSFDPLEKVTKYCDESGNWVHSSSINKTWSHCLTFSKEKIKAYIQILLLCIFSKTNGFFFQTLPVHGFLETETELDPTAESQVSPVVTQKVEERKKIINGQYKCFEKMNRDQPYNKSGPYCNRTWDGWLCWDDTPAGTYTSQNCPNYFPDFDSTEKVTKYCDETGNWFRHPETNRTWSNYTLCIAHTKDKLKVGEFQNCYYYFYIRFKYGKKSWRLTLTLFFSFQMAYILYYMAIVGHALSIVSLLISLAIFFYFRSLSCQRITLHKNLFCSYVLNSAFTIVNLITVVNNPKVVQRNPIGCKVLHFFHMYMLGCNYFWMLCEGIYLHTLIVVAVFAEEQHLHWYYLLGWGFPLVPASIHAVARKKYFDDNCWMSVDTHLLYVVHGPIMAALLVNLFFLLNIVRVLVTKLRDTHRAESNMYMKAVRATLILVPLLGIQFVIFPWRPENRLAGEIYDYIMHILMNYQGLLVATIFCFFNGEVQGTLKRQWMQYKTQWGQRRREHCSTRSTSYTATSITEVPAFMYHHDCNSEHLNGKQTEDSELVALKTGETYA
uniref:Calcitonin receptor n=1 Tax=Cyprinus carpio TaxID=7962 RepID=A0A8C2IGR2_CYPCA